MSKVNYNEISQIYDSVRHADVELLNNFLQEISIDEETRILDVGCGTGNYTNLLQKVTQSKVYGLEPSSGMLEKAKEKETAVVFKQGNAAALPFEDDYFDFVYMTDVIHHVPNIEAMFAEIYRVLKTPGTVSVVTQSHQQIENRPIVKYFPGTAKVDQARYPDIDEIIHTAEEQMFKFSQKTILHENESVELDDEYLALVQRKGYSMLHLIAEDEYSKGVKQLENDLVKGKISTTLSGETLVWLVKI